MEITCSRCHRTVLDENCYCPACGLPQFVFSAEGAPGQPQPERPGEPPRDASSVEWKAALRAALLLAVPAGLLSSAGSPLVGLGLFWMLAAASCTVVLYMRNQRPAWITIGAGARIGLVTGLLAGWLAFTASGTQLFVQRFFFHQAARIDAEWKERVEASQQFTQQWAAQMQSPDPAQAKAEQAQIVAFMLSPGGHAGVEAFGFASASVFLALFSVAGGALGARLLAGVRKPEI